MPEVSAHGTVASSRMACLLEQIASSVADEVAAIGLVQRIVDEVANVVQANLVAFILCYPRQYSCELVAVAPSAARRLMGQRLPMRGPLEAFLDSSTKIVHANVGDGWDSLSRLLRGMGIKRVAMVRVKSAEEWTLVLCAGRTGEIGIPSSELVAIAEAIGVGIDARPAARPLFGQDGWAAGLQGDALVHIARTIAHDLKNALASIVGHCELMLSDSPPERYRKRIENILRRSAELLDIVRSLEEYAAEQIEAPQEKVDLATIANEVVRVTSCVWETEARRRGKPTDLRVNISQSVPVMGVASELRKALIHLLFNAIQAVEDGGRIAVRVYASGDEAVCEIEDTGTGMDEETLKRAREPFFTTRGPSARGLGLSIAEAVVRQHNGYLQILSSPGEGTRAIIFLPLAVSRTSGMTTRTARKETPPP